MKIDIENGIRYLSQRIIYWNKYTKIFRRKSFVAFSYAKYASKTSLQI